jgi:hypothetical protein
MTRALAELVGEPPPVRDDARSGAGASDATEANDTTIITPARVLRAGPRVEVIRARSGAALAYGLLGVQFPDHPLIENEASLLVRLRGIEGTRCRFPAALQPLPPGSRLFRNSAEAKMAKFFAEARWATDVYRPGSRADRARFFGRLNYARRVVSHVVRQALAGVDPEALRIARSYGLPYRHSIFLLSSYHERVRQLARAFPLALPALAEAEESRRALALDAILSGRKLREVAEILDLPPAARCLPPAAANSETFVWLHELPPEIIRAAPRKARPARRWARGLAQLVNSGHLDVEFACWLTRRWPEIERDGHADPRYISDWARRARRGIDAVECKRFDPRMHVRAALAAARDWHRKMSLLRVGTNKPLPPPWLPAGQVGELEIVPLSETAELVEEGAALQHCVVSYSQDALEGRICLYSVRRPGDERVATLELSGGPADPRIAQLRARANAEPGREITNAVRRWLALSKRGATASEAL